MIEQQQIPKNEGEKTFKSNLQQIVRVFVYLPQKIAVFTPQPVKNFLTRIYSNKKIFVPVTVAFSMILIVLIMGLLFGNINRNKDRDIVKKEPISQIVDIPQKEESETPSSAIRNVLKDLKSEINTLDINQNKIKPPDIDFEIGFN